MVDSRVDFGHASCSWFAATKKSSLAGIAAVKGYSVTRQTRTHSHTHTQTHTHAHMHSTYPLRLASCSRSARSLLLGLCSLAVAQVNPEAMGRLYRDIIIPLTKDVEVDYLMKRI